jgi:hypothetical protein
LRKWHWVLIALIVALCVAYGTLSHFMGGPRDVYGFLRYALPQWHRGPLRVGDAAPDFRLYTLDGRQTFTLRDRMGPRPLVLIFGSYT